MDVEEVDVWAQCLEGHQAGSQQEALEERKK